MPLQQLPKRNGDNMKLHISVSQSIVTPESAENGDYAAWDNWNCESVREAFDDVFKTRTNAVDGVTGKSASWVSNGKRFTFYIDNGMEYETGDYESRSVHIHGISKASANRLAKLFGVELEDF